MQQFKKIKRLLFFSASLNLIFAVLFLLGFIFYGKSIINKVFPDRSMQRDIVMYGDSITGSGEWGKLIPGKSIANEGIGHGGLTTSHLVKMVTTNVIAHKPRICFIEGGINDLYVGVPIPRIKTNLISLADTLKSAGIIPVLTLITYTSNDAATNLLIDSVNTIINAIIKEKNIDGIDLNDNLSENNLLKKKYSRDGVHFTKEAYPIWAEEVKAILKKHNL